MKKLISFILFSFLLIGCTNEKQNDSFEFTSGVDKKGLSYGDSVNYTNIEGTSLEGDFIYVIYEGYVTDNIKPNEDGTFSYHTMAGLEPASLLFTDDPDLKLGDENIETSQLENFKTVNIHPNEEYLQQQSEVLKNIPSNGISINQAAIITDDDENWLYNIKINKATKDLSQTDDIYTNGKPENTIEVTYEYKNYAYGDLLEVSSQFLSVFDSDGDLVEPVSLQDEQIAVPDGQTGTATAWFVMSEPVENLDYVEIVYGGDTSLGFEGYRNFMIPLD